MPQFTKVATTDELAPGKAKIVVVDGREIAVFNIDGSFHAIDNECTHAGGPLGEGELDRCEVTCPWHGALFDVTSGQVLGPPAAAPVNSYPVRVSGVDVEIEA